MLLVVLCAAGGYGCGQNKLTADEARAIAKEATV